MNNSQQELPKGTDNFLITQIKDLKVDQQYFLIRVRISKKNPVNFFTNGKSFTFIGNDGERDILISTFNREVEKFYALIQVIIIIN